ncbi:hypothetical protein [Oxalobacter paraformigenes]|uniref:hypothetical protein n=1 Tax=Oxalobacter paraformigenes TaxID=556268 RepID=UPI0002F43CC8|nr:hypothetical protein [Oxalobacter paraformigenes]
MACQHPLLLRPQKRPRYPCPPCRKNAERDTRALPAAIAVLTGLAGQSTRPEAAEKALA